MESIVDTLSNVSSREETHKSKRQRIIVTFMIDYRHQHESKGTDLLINLIKISKFTFRSRIIHYQPYGTSFDRFTIVKTSILPPLSVTQTLILNNNIFHVINNLVDHYNNIIVIGGMRIERFISSLKKYELRH